MAAHWTRRAFLISAAAIPEQGRRVPSERVRFVDESTEFRLFRLTDPAYASYLPSSCMRAISRRRTFLVFTSHRTGSPQPFRANLATGEMDQLASARDLDSATLGLLPDDRACCYFDGPSLMRAVLTAPRGVEVYRIPQGWARTGGLSLSPDGAFAFFAERGKTTSRIRRVRLRDGVAATVLETAGALRDPIPRPGTAHVLYRQEQPDALWLAPGGVRPGAPEAPRVLVEERAGWPVFWSQDGSTLLYLRLSSRPGEPAVIRELDVGTAEAHDIAPATGFVSFAPNRDGSVFAGANGSKAAPFLILMLRVNRKELPICEHRASDPGRVAPVFSADSQLLFFQSDRDGGPAIYYVPLERIIEATAP